MASYEFTVDPFVVAGGGPSSESSPDIAVLANGNFGVVWESYTLAGGQTRAWKLFSGATVAQSGTLPTQPLWSETSDVAPIGSGLLFLSSANPELHGVSGQYTDIFRTLSTGGTAALVNAGTAETQRWPHVAQLADGSYITIWYDDRNDPGHGGVYGRKLNGGGAPVGSDFVLAGGPGLQGLGEGALAVDARSGGGFVVSWSAMVPGSLDSLYFRNYDASGAPVGGPVLVAAAYGLASARTDVAALSNGSTAIAYTVNSNQALVALHAPDGSLITTVDVAAATTGNQAYNSGVIVTGLADGGFFAAWSSFNFDPGVGQARSTLRGAQFDSTGALVVDAVDIESSGYNDTPDAEELPNHDIAVTWLHTATNNADVHAAVLHSDLPSPDNHAPTAALSGGGNYAARIGGSVAFDASASSDPDSGDTLQYRWDFGDGAVSDFAAQTGASHAYDAPGAYAGVLTVEDGRGGVSTANFAVSVAPANTAPTGDAGGPYTALIGAPVTFDASHSTDPDTVVDDSLSFAWDFGDGNELFDNGSGAVLTLTAAQVQALGEGVHAVRLRVSDSLGEESIVSTTLTVTGLTIEGTPGDDLLASTAANEAIDGKGGSDTVSYAGVGGPVTVDLSLAGAAQATGAGGRDTLISIENLTGSALGDRLTGGAGANLLDGGGGDDVLAGGGGGDVLAGGAGTDTASYAGAAGGVTVNLGLSGLQDTGGDGVDRLSSIENLVGSNAGDSLKGNAGANVIEGMGGADSLEGGAGDDILKGGDGDDSYFLVDLGDTVVEIGGQGVDTVTAGFSYTLTDNVENLTLRYTGAATGLGNGLGNTMIGNVAANTLDGAAGDDILQGGGGGDTLYGRVGVDRLEGGAGDDIITGGHGQDVMAGGTGADRFVFTAPSDSVTYAPDTITDMVKGDHIDLHAIDANAGVAGDQDFHLGATPGHVGDIVLGYDYASNRTVLVFYINSDAVADGEILLTGNLAAGIGALSDADFFL